MWDAQLERAITLTQQARRIHVFTGAGMSAESGLDTYRDAQTGVWSNVDPQAMASIDAWAKDPEPMWAWYLWRARLASEAEPNAGHRAIAAWQQLPQVDEVIVTTQNIDDLHERGGSSHVTHLHGSLFRFRCTICSRPWKAPIDYPDQPVERLTPPTCPLCHNPIRPGVVWFGEPLPNHDWQRAESAMTNCDVLIIVGTSGVVYPAAGLPRLAAALGTPIIEISPEPTELSDIATLSWRSTAATALPQLVDSLAGLT
ncbi:NAD-dependent protein deacylase [Corynebacterium poyangense]|uniref:NAD-dependent protein deacylase n=1 Tax=Corynebacterium poyangense TaxID=2684405 RepID=A0A7H0SL97_9CORY|nr:NAD-dependent deacylase [Corynebacterium poyangense]MBZ8177412.1 NAD-dependent protein deacylase [Corynebacterium poyangense]QNQ89322.1 NAD-dependent protein deacylase [Corynebacterium poyangense]